VCVVMDIYIYIYTCTVAELYFSTHAGTHFHTSGNKYDVNIE